MELQKKLHEQLESQRQLQLSLDAHGKYISSLIERQGLHSRLPDIAARTGATPCVLYRHECIAKECCPYSSVGKGFHRKLT